jgi:hypothetical protein
VHPGTRQEITAVKVKTAQVSITTAELTIAETVTLIWQKICANSSLKAQI